jgi:hypothetical protein
MTRLSLTALIIALLGSLTALPALALPAINFNFESAAEDWAPSTLDKGSRTVQTSTTRASQGKSSLAITGELPAGFGATYVPWQDWTGYEQLSFDLWVPANAPREFDLWVYLKDKQYHWYQTAPFRSPTTGKPTGAFKPGRWMTIKLDISPTSTLWQPGGHRKAWDRALYYPREFGLRVFSRSQWSGTIYLDNLQFTGNALPLGKHAGTEPKLLTTPLTVTSSAKQVPVFRKLELSFKLNRHYENPFDPEVVDVQGHFTGPQGQKIDVPGFIYQDYERSRDAAGHEQLIPVGATFWKVRFAPPVAGPWTYSVSVRDARGLTRSPEASFTATPPADPRGYVRVSAKDPRCFEFDNGQFYFPTGLNMRDGGDQAAAQPGTYAFDEYFKLFAEKGLDFCRTWMAAWWGGIEWSDKYHSRFDGVGRYSLYNAWRLDYAFDLAEKHGLRLELTLNSHGQFRRDKFDAEWMYNPYSIRNGGFVATPAMFFTSPTVREMTRRRYRYLVARWGYSQNLMSWDMVNEVDLAEGYNRQEVAAWHAEMAGYLRSIDYTRRLICTHICLYGYGQELFELPQIDYVQADAYWKRRDIGMNEGWAARQHFEKPFLFIEYGPQTVSLPISYEKWQQDFRVGMWVSNLIPGAAPGQFWYHEEWKEHKLWRYQQGLLAFNRGEDRRGLHLRKINATAHAANGVPLTVQAMGNGRRGDFYVFSFENLIHPEPDLIPADQRLPAATVSLQGFEPGNYVAEYWDTLTGQVLTTTLCQVENGVLRLQTPPFPADLACKIRPAT